MALASQGEQPQTHRQVLTVRDFTLGDTKPNVPPESAIRGAEL